MTVALRRQMQELTNAVPHRTQGERDQLWRNVATELNHRNAAATPSSSARFRTFSLFGIVAFAVILVVFLPVMNQSHTGRHFLRTSYLEAAARKDQVQLFDWHADSGTNGFHRVASNPKLELLLYEGGTQFLLRHKPTGQLWSTSPDIRDARVPESMLGHMSSPFAIRYGDESGRVDAWANPVDHMTMLEYYPLSSGMGLRFVFDHIGIAVRVDYQLGDGYLQVTVPENGIQEYGAFKVKAIEIMPFFDAVGDSGAKKQLVATTPQTEMDGLSAMMNQKVDNGPLLFGVAGEKAGYLAEVVEGADVASIHVDPSGFMVDANRVFVEFQLAGKGTPQSKSSSGQLHAVRYYALTEEATGFDGVAEVFQRHMKDRLGTNRRVIDSDDSDPFGSIG